MSGVATLSRAPFAARTSAFDDFLYASIGEEDNGMVLTALSALARLGVDPWDEAARLSALPREMATKRLTSIIAGLSHGRWASPENIAGRLTALLPVQQTSPVQISLTQILPTKTPAVAPAKAPVPVVMLMFLAVIFVNILAFSILRHHEVPPGTSQSTAASSGATSSGATHPKVPVP